jgi:arginyl-tRNA synthetase
MKSRLTALLSDAVNAGVGAGLQAVVHLPFIDVEATRDVSHGDYASNVSMVLASHLKMNPRKIAEAIIKHISTGDNFLEKIEIAGPGFINFFIKDDIWRSVLRDVDVKGECYGENDLGAGQRVQVEFVSANPTGPLHIGHARGAVVGDVIAGLLEASHFSVYREYYINDAGNQMNNLGKSVMLRLLELTGEQVDFPDDCYRGNYIRDIAREILQKERDSRRATGDAAISFFTAYAANVILEEIKKDLSDFGVVFSGYFSENELYKNGDVAKILSNLEEKGFIYNDGETLWFRSTAFGDEKDRVVVRKNGEPTYFAADIAYHENKFQRGFDKVIDIWGADHHGYIPRLTASVESLGHDRESLKIVLVQLVNLLRDGKPVAMSTRSGEFVTMKEVVDEVGKDAARYNFLMRRSDSHLDFDLELAKRQSSENPVYYVQYAHARICSIFVTAGNQGYGIPSFSDVVDIHRLNVPEEISLIKAIARFPEVVEGAVRTLEPHRLTFYLNDLAATFHNYYNKHKVVSPDRELTEARLFLVKSIRTVLRNALKLLGVSAPEKM